MRRCVSKCDSEIIGVLRERHRMYERMRYKRKYVVRRWVRRGWVVRGWVMTGCHRMYSYSCYE